MSARSPEELKPSVISPHEALLMYGEGARRLRKPEPRRLGPNGIDTNSFDFRGVRSAMNVLRTFPHETDAEGQRAAVDPEALKAHMDLGLTAIRDAGHRPLNGEFVEGYQRMADAFARPPQEPTSSESIGV